MQMARRRRKLNSSVLFPMVLTSKDLIYQGNASEVAPEANYELSSIVLHTGTAQSGHYRSYCRDPASKKWFDYNDANVTELDAQDEASLFWFDNSKGANIVDACEKGMLSSKRDMIYENAYMLCYSRVNENNASVPATVYPSALLEEIKAQNEEFKKLQEAYEIMKNIVNVTAVAAKTDGKLISNESVTLELKIDSTLADATQSIYNALMEKKIVEGGFNVDDYRLRRFNSTSLWVMDTFTGKEEQTLKSLGLEGTTVIPLAFEVKLSPEDTFGEFNPNEMRVRMYNWAELVAVGYDKSKANVENSQTEGDAGAESPRSAASFNTYEFPCSVKASVVVIPGEQNAKVKDLREMLANQHEVTAERVNIIRCNQRNVTLIDDDEKLFKDFNIFPDEELIVEIIPDDSVRATYASVALEKLLQMRRNITISFNNPLTYNPEATGDENVYTLSLKAPLETTLLEVKEMIVQVVNKAATDKSNILEVGNFHVRRNANAPQIKREKSTLEELEFVNNSVLHVQVRT